MGFKEKLGLSYVRTKFGLLSLLSKRKAAGAAFELFCTPQFRNTKELPPVFEKAEMIRFSFQGYEIQGYRWNSTSEQKVQILHGFESSVVNFDQYVQPLIDKGFCVLAFDAPAHGRSSGKTTNVIMYKEFIEHIYKTYGPVKNYICHSLGGLSLSLAMEIINPDHSFKLALIAPATETPTAIDMFFKVVRLKPDVRKEFDRIIEEKSGHPPAWFSVVRAIQKTKAQILWIHDRDDDMTPLADAEHITSFKVPNVTFVVTEGLGHRRIYRDKEVRKMILNFITGDTQ